jgi:hypothetical protein
MAASSSACILQRVLALLDVVLACVAGECAVRVVPYWSNGSGVAEQSLSAVSQR